ncbi:hypothetical protein Dalk_1986 [Desulfatibacillum aliphaticivorans]|uniref:Uncharacterized protein n=1 Tax=Desulfatibacillum aliphaticivorans TaxID=218208 RepID=B8FG02_DESAL|nr:hypothetical protein [Desulfatibacillum aliphaticivorans]ACL03682.1 hypothetical protein Dalk_1986 [Desulfatibacillum aliphaticivorans]
MNVKEMKQSLGDHQLNTKPCKSDILRLFKRTLPLFIIPITILMAVKFQWQGAIAGLCLSLFMSLFISTFLYVLELLLAKTEIYSLGVFAMDSTGNRPACMKWEAMDKAYAGSLFIFPVIIVEDSDGSILTLLNSIKDRETMTQKIKDLAGPDNPLYLFLREELLKSKE